VKFIVHSQPWIVKIGEIPHEICVASDYKRSYYAIVMRRTAAAILWDYRVRSRERRKKREQRT
jgi:hypothetical protein